MNLTFDVVITTYNRPEHIVKFCKEILQCSPKPNKLIVIDSSDATNKELQSNTEVIYRKSSHKSQPYQRYVGYLVSSADILVFFDDDLEIKDNSLFETIANTFIKNKDLIGLGLGIDYHNPISTTLIKPSHNIFNTILKVLRPKILPGQITRFGQTAALPQKNIDTTFLPGPNMCFNRNMLEDVFDETMFALFEKKMGMGEDKVISMRVAAKGKMMYLGEKTYLYHPPIESTYFNNLITFWAKVFYSRIWIAHQYNKINPSHFHHIWVLLFIIKSNLTINSVSKLKSILLAIKWVAKYGYIQRHIIGPKINYYEDAKRDAA
ncbi:MAG: glycosyltransferase [Bacteroidia bacterium]|nr:glycosyltransferase [Bacteroidia bacterium]MBP9688328.1 glycosyltransferase [Bacteroidia bacterium]